MTATPATLDLTYAGLKPNGKPELDAQGRPPDKQGGRPGKSMSPKQIRARARRKQKMLEKELDELYKPVEEWDAEELARGRPRDRNGGWSGSTPAYVTRAFHEQIIKRFQVVVREEMNKHTIEALEVMRKVLTDETVDLRGKPLVSPATKLQAATYLLDHVVGKPTQRVEQDISVKLQGLLGTVMVTPTGELAQGSQPLSDIVDAEVVDDDD